MIRDRELQIVTHARGGVDDKLVTVQLSPHVLDQLLEGVQLILQVRQLMPVASVQTRDADGERRDGSQCRQRRPQAAA